MTAREAFFTAKRRLMQSGADEPEAKAKVIISHVLGISFSDVYADTAISDMAHGEIDVMIRRCMAGEPVEYVTGRTYFRYVALDVTPDVLIPRQETEQVAQKAIALIGRYGYRTAADIGTGSGCIAISLALETPVRVDALDISEKALDVARRNARKNNVSDLISFILSDLFQNAAETYDIIVSNPPYVSDGEYAALSDGVRLHEPKQALAAGDGLAYYRRIAPDAFARLRVGGSLVLEIGAGQAKAIAGLLQACGFDDILCEKDYQGRDRIVSARKDKDGVNDV